MRRFPFIALLALAACKPPPTDADMLRDMPETEPTFASAPLPSPITEGAMWALSQRTEGRLIYGVPGEAALLSLECDTTATPTLRLTRTSPADEGAGALLALVGNGHIGRIMVDATEVSGGTYWVGEAAALDEVWEPLAGPRELIATVPGGGTVNIDPSPLPRFLIEACRRGELLNDAALMEAQQAEEDDTAESASPTA
ncbi:MAG: hypothetical protein AAFY42_09490 [Pseudomonadota bacterium]